MGRPAAVQGAAQRQYFPVSGIHPGDTTMDLSEAVKAHSEWKIKLRSAISSKSTLDAVTIGRDDCCPLGKWLHGESRARYGELPSHATCVQAHAEFHREAANVAQVINQKDYARAEKMLEANTAYSHASGGVVLAIGTLKREAKL